MTDKTTMKYRVFTSRNPKTGGALLRPIIVDRQTMNFRQLVAYARSAGFVCGQQMDLEGAIGGLLEAAKDRSLAGYAINFNNWFIISGRIRGPVDAWIVEDFSVRWSGRECRCVRGCGGGRFRPPVAGVRRPFHASPRPAAHPTRFRSGRASRPPRCP